MRQPEMAFILCLYIRLGVLFLNCFIVERCASYSAAARFYKLDVWLSLIGFESPLYCFFLGGVDIMVDYMFCFCYVYVYVGGSGYAVGL